jgi:uncharacterized membrane protein YbhN (UPF0104 family)
VNKYVRLAISAVLLGWIAWHTDWVRVRDAFAGLRVELWLAAVGTLVASQVVSAMRWQLFARELRFDRTVRQLTGFYLIGMYFNLLLPTSVGGDVMRAWYLDGGAKRRLAAFAAVLLDRLNGLFVLIAMTVLAVALSPLELPAWIPWSVWGIAAAAVLGLAALPAAGRFRLLPLQRREQLATMVQLLRAPRVCAQATVLSAVVQVANVIAVWLIGLALGADIPFGYYFVFVPMVALLTLLPVSVNGMGVREGGTALFLAPLGVEQATALTLAFLWFAAFGAVSLVGGLVYLSGGYPRPRTEPDPAEVTKDGPVDRDPDQGREGQLEQAA